ncbi:MAG: glycoside hydrolase family 3 C-terminal domain-containing protein [Solobacterium sp.]|nr:glycoside hydrolase family 3 C-terminal domain-containing protein [Solobacterium sp.]
MFVSDWGGVSDPAASVIHGLNLIMPGDHRAETKIQEAMDRGVISQEKLDECVNYIIDLAKKVSHHSPKPYDMQKHLDLALKAAEESIVLLKNEDILPVKKDSSFLLVGNILKASNHGGNGSSRVEAISVDHVADIFEKRKINYEFYSGKSIEKTIRLAKEKDIVIVGAGYYEKEESEGYDRRNMRLSAHQNRLIQELCKNHDHVIVVIQTGSPVEMPWKDDVEGILYMNLSGSRGGSALTNILFGISCPSARLAETFPVHVKDVPSYSYFSNNPHQMEYREGIFTGYRYYDTFDIPVNYSFGHGLSYTHFSYSNLKTEDYSLSFTLKNDGEYDARNTVFLYIGMQESAIARPAKELKAFQSVYLKKGEERRITFNLEESMFQYYDVRKHDWMVEEGMYQLMVGGAVNEIFLQTEMYHEGIQDPYTSIQKEFYDLSEGKLQIEKASFEKMLGRQIPKYKDNIDADSSLKDLELHTFRFLAKILSRKKELLPGVRLSTIQETPLRQILMADQKITWETIDGMVAFFNGMPIKGLRKIRKSLK